MTGLVAGQQVDHFRILRKLGEGGMSEVYLARDVILGRKVALKIVRADFLDSPRRLKLFLHEARLTAKFAHQHIITIYSVGEFEGHPYLALEHLEGQTLSQRIREGAMSAPEVMRIGLAIAQALEEAHSHGVLHRDLKPANVFITQDGRLRVLDFGLSQITEDSSNTPELTRDSVSQIQEEDSQSKELLRGLKPGISVQLLDKNQNESVSTIVGTPAYMAPERWLIKETSGAIDVWALGVILYKMLTQDHPFHRGKYSSAAFVQSITSAKEPIPFPPNLNIPSELSKLILSMLDRKASQRPTAQQIALLLQELLRARRTQLLKSESPFRGLLPFSERHADLFFGRNAEIEMAVVRLRSEPIFPVVGPSGAGKSSFVAAGIVPRS